MSFISDPKMAKIRFEELIDIEELTTLFEHFYKATSFLVGMVDLKGNVLIGTGWQEMCTEFHRKHPETLDNCRKSDLSFQGNISHKKYHFHKCKNGLIDLAIPIKIEGIHLANLFFGQFYWKGEKPTEKDVKKSANKYGFDEQAYLEAFRKVPCYDKSEIEKLVNFYESMVNIITNMGSTNLKLKYNSEFLTEIYEATAAAIFIVDVEGDGIFRFKGLNPAHEKASGLKSKDVEGKTIDDLSHIIPKEAIEEIKRRYQQCVDFETQIEYEEMITMLGKEHWWLTTLTPIKNHSGKVVRIMGSAIEISELKKTQQKLEDHKANLENLVQEKQGKLIDQNYKLQEKIEKEAIVEEQLRASNEQLEEEITERKIAQHNNEILISNLGKRVKEMECINKVNEFLENDDLTIDQVLKNTAKIMPAAFSTPDKTFCMIRFYDQNFTSGRFAKTPNSHLEDLYINEKQVGYIKVYLDHPAPGKANLFQSEELTLISNIATILTQAIIKNHAFNRFRITDLAIKNAPTGHILADLKGNITDTNMALVNMFGFATEDDLRKKSFSSLLAENSKADEIIPCIQHTGNWHRETKARRPDGTTFDIDLSTNLVRDENGKPIAIAASFMDITDRKTTEGIIKESNAKFKALSQNLMAAKKFTDAIIDSLPGIFFMLNSRYELVRWNRAFTEITGYTDDEIPGKSPTDFLTGKNENIIAEQIESVFSKGTAHVNARLSNKQKKQIPVVFTGRLMETKEDKFLIGHGTNITDLKETQENLARSEAMLQVLLDATNDTIALINKKGIIKKINTSGAKRFNNDPELLTGKNVYKLLPPEVSKTRKKLIDKVFNTGKPQIFEDSRNNWFFENRVFPVFDKNNKVPLVGIFAIDITKRRRAENQLIESEKRFRSFFDQGLIGMAITSPDKGWVRVNQRVLDMFGYPEKELFNKSWADMSHPDDLPIDSELHQKLLNLEISQYSLEKRFIKKDGSIVHTNLWVRSVVIDNSVDHIYTLIDDISASKQAKEELKKSQHRLILATGGANAGIWDWKLGTNEVFYSAIWKKHVGYEDHELENDFSTWENLLHPDDSERMHKAVESYLKNPDGNFIEEFRMRHKNGTYRWIRNEASCLKGKKGNIYRMFGVHTDITGKKLAEEALKESEERHRLIFESVNDAIIILNLEGKIVEVNPAATRIYGYSKEEFLELDPHKLLHDEWQHELENFFKTTAAGENYSGENMEYTKSGQIMYTQVHGSPLDFRGEKHIMALIRDITSLKKAQEGLKHSKEQLQLITDLIPVLVSYVKPDHTYEFVNKGYESWFGVKAENIVGKHAKDVVGENAYSLVKNDLDRVFNGETIESERMMPSKSGGTRYTQTTFLPHKKGSTIRGAIICVSDVSPLKEKEFELRELLNELEQSNKELEQFAYVASHDLQEPLRMVSSFLQLLERKYYNQIDNDGKEFIHFAVDGANRMKTLISDLLKYSRVGTRGKPFATTDMNMVIRQVITNLSGSIEESGVKVEVGELPKVNVDESQMIQLFQNLVSNAIKFRGRVDPFVKIDSTESDEAVTLIVEDNGIGIEPRFHDRIFVIFQRLHPPDIYPGTGIGLSVCKKIVDRHHGEIKLESETGVGTTFKIILPKHLQNGAINTTNT